MSLSCLRKVLDTKQVSAVQRLALVGLADDCSDDGEGLFVAETISQWIGDPSVSVHAVVSDLTKAGMIEFEFDESIGRWLYRLRLGCNN